MLLIFVLALLLGLSTAWYMIEEGSALTTSRVGPWTVWRSAGKPDADPYTKAHMARAGRLPITATRASCQNNAKGPVGPAGYICPVKRVAARPVGYEPAGSVINGEAPPGRIEWPSLNDIFAIRR